MIDHNLPLPLAIESERRLFTGGSAGLLNYYVDESGGGRPLVLIHSINAAASAYEMRPIFEHYRGRRLVYALDLPGFGFSERSDRYYSRDLYVGAIRDFLEDVVSEPADVVALSLSSEFSALVAKETPDRIHSLALISPTGLSESEGDTELGENRRTGRSEALLNLFSFPLWSQAFYDLLVTWPSIRYFLGKSFDGAVDEGLADYAYLSSHQPGARYAPLHFVSGQLFTPGILSATYSRLERPALIVYDKDPFTSFESLPDLLLDQPSWSAARITPTSGLPQFEQMDVLAKVLDNYWHSLEK
jgi:pimeloyl-ACP methyl ester carboxylesterase